MHVIDHELIYPDIGHMLILTSLFCISQKISEIAHSHGAIVLVDNSIMSPVLSRPIELGAGIKSCIYVTKI